MDPDEICLEELIAYIMTVCKQQNDKLSYIGSWSGKKLSASAANCLQREMFICSHTEANGKIAELGFKFKSLGSFTFSQLTFPHREPHTTHYISPFTVLTTSVSTVSTYSDSNQHRNVPGVE